MKKVLLTSLALYLLSSSTVYAAAPAVVKWKNDPAPIFIGAQDLFTTGGEFATVVPTFWREQHNAMRATERERPTVTSALKETSTKPCGGDYMTESDPELLVSRDTAAENVQNAKAIYLGRIKSVKPGFFLGMPGSLLELGELVTLKTTSAFVSVQESVLVRHPYAHFTAGGVEYCRETRATALAPEVGDRVLVFAFDDPVDEAGQLIYSNLEDLIIARGGDVRIPRLLRAVASGAVSIDEIAKAISKINSTTEAEAARSRVR
jgi:hypothetical protein